MIRHFVLPPDQAHRAIAAGGPLAELQVDPARLAEMTVGVVEVDGEIASYWVVWYALHAEPLFIVEKFRNNPAVVGQTVEVMQEIVEATGEPAAFCVIEAENLEVVSGYAQRLGFLEAPGKLYYLVLREPAPEPVKG